jgi:hypothetical protein
LPVHVGVPRSAGLEGLVLALVAVHWVALRVQGLVYVEGVACLGRGAAAESADDPVSYGGVDEGGDLVAHGEGGEAERDLACC